MDEDYEFYPVLLHEQKFQHFHIYNHFHSDRYAGGYG